MATSILGQTAVRAAKLEVVTELPKIGKKNQIYLVPNKSSVSGDAYDEYIWINNTWEFLGNKRLELTIDSNLEPDSTNPVENSAIYWRFLGVNKDIEVNRNNIVVLTGRVDEVDGIAKGAKELTKINEERINGVQATANEAKALVEGLTTVVRRAENDISQLKKLNVSGTLRDLYISAGAVYNEQTGYYELNGLTDITEEQMRVIYRYAGTPQVKDAFAYSKARTNLPMPGMYNGSVYEYMFYSCTNLEVAYLGNRQLSPISYDFPLVYTEGNNFFYLCTKLKKIYGKIHQRINDWDLTFGDCLALEEVRIADLYSSIQLSWSPNLSKESVQYMITNAKPLSGAAVGSITITLHPTAYARLKDDADIVAALEAKGGIVTLVSA